MAGDWKERGKIVQHCWYSQHLWPKINDRLCSCTLGSAVAYLGHSGEACGSPANCLPPGGEVGQMTGGKQTWYTQEGRLLVLGLPVELLNQQRGISEPECGCGSKNVSVGSVCGCQREQLAVGLKKGLANCQTTYEKGGMALPRSSQQGRGTADLK